MRYLTLSEILEIHGRVMEQSGGLAGIRDLGALESSLAQPRMTFAGTDLYPTLVEKASALGFSLIRNHPSLDGNKRSGHAAMEVFLFMNGREIKAMVDEEEQIVLLVAAGSLDRQKFTEWLRAHTFARMTP